MKLRILAISICFFSLFVANAQDKKWSGELYYPISIGDPFGSSNQGIIGANLSYRFADLSKASLGVTLDGSWFATTFIEDSDPVQESDFRDFFLQAMAFYDTPLTPNQKLRFRGALGWAYQDASRSPAFFDNNGQIVGNTSTTGPLIGAGLTYAIAPRWFVGARTDFMFLFGDSPNRSIGLLKLGIGFRF